MTDIRSEVVKALPYLSGNVLSLLFVRLEELGVEEPQDMRLVEERDLACVLKVIQCRKLLNHFKASFGYNTSWIASPSAPSPCKTNSYQVNRTRMPSEIVKHCKSLSRSPDVVHNSYTPADLQNCCIQSETVSAQHTLTNTDLSTVNIAPFTVSSPFTLPEPSSTSEEHNTVPQTFVTSSTVTPTYSQYAIEAEMREATPTSKSMTDAFQSVPPLQATSSIKHDIDDDASLYESKSNNCEISASDFFHPGNRETPDEMGNVLTNYQFPLGKLPDSIRNILLNKKEIRKPFSHDLVRCIVTDLLSKCARPTIKEISVAAKTAVDAYPESLGSIMSGRNSKPGFESFLNMISNRINNIKYSGNEKSFTSSNEGEQTGQVKHKKPLGRPKGSKRFKSCDSNKDMNLSSTYTSSELVCGVYQIPLEEAPQEIHDCLKQKEPLTESSKSVLIQIVVDDLLKKNSNLTQEVLKVVSRSIVATFSGSLKSRSESAKLENDFFQGLDEEIKKRDAGNLPSKDFPSKNLTTPSPSHDVQLNNNNVSVEMNSTKTLTPFERWNTLRNYKVPLEKLPLFIQKDLIAGIPIEDETRDEFIEVIIHDVRHIVPHPNRDDIKIIAKAIVRAYPESLQMRIKNNRFTYLGFLKKFMEIAVNITGDENLSFTFRAKRPRSVPNVLREEENSSVISKNELMYFQKVKSGLQSQSRNEEWNDSVADAMSTTFPLQRLEIKDSLAVKDLKDSWPYLFNEKGFLLHLRLLLGTCLKTRMEQNFKHKNNTLLNYFANQDSKQEDIHEILSEMFTESSSRLNRGTILLILNYFGEKRTQLLYTFEIHKGDLGALPLDPCIVTFVSGNATFSSENYYSVYVQRILVVRNVSFTTAFIIYFGTFLVFKLSYPPSLIHTLEFVQRCLAEIPPRQDFPISEEVSDKVDYLIRNTQSVI